MTDQIEIECPNCHHKITVPVTTRTTVRIRGDSVTVHSPHAEQAARTVQPTPIDPDRPVSR